MKFIPILLFLSSCSTLPSPKVSHDPSRSELNQLQSSLKETLELTTDSRGLVQAADRMDTKEQDPTHYDAVWVRDSLWVYLGLSVSEDPKERAIAKKMLLALSDYFSSSDQIKRMEAVIRNPKIIDFKNGKMNTIHIRFDRNSATFQDVQENGKQQIWNHKQNDALGLFLDLFCRAVLDQSFTSADLTPLRLKAIHLLPKYFNAVQFYKMEDAGSWEEIERTNTSSIALVVSGLERLQEVRKVIPIKVDDTILKRLIEKGYSRIHQQIELGGESPDYPKNDPRYRTSDAALLNLIYPAKLAGLNLADYSKVVNAIDPLIGEIGIKRYIGDSYQSGNFWKNEGSTDDTSSSENFSNRGKKFIEGSEAQWFFDSWYSLAMGILVQKFNDKNLKIKQVQFLNRALKQITKGSKSNPVLGADGIPVRSGALPESYNTLVNLKTGVRTFAPSPITPLNWAKASMRLAIDEMKNTSSSH